MALKKPGTAAPAAAIVSGGGSASKPQAGKKRSGAGSAAKRKQKPNRTKRGDSASRYRPEKGETATSQKYLRTQRVSKN